MMFGPGSVFAGKKNENKKESISRTASSSNMFSMLSSQTAEIADSTAKRRFPSSLNLQILTAFLAIEPQRKRLVLQPRSKPVEATETTEGASPDADSDSSVDDSPSPVAAEMSEKSALKKIDEDAKEFFAVRNIHEDDYFTDLPPKFHSKVVEKLAGRAVEAKAADAELLAQFFAHASSKGLCAPEAFEEGLGAIAEFIDDIICDAPKALELFAIILKGAGLDENRQASIAAKSSENSDKLLGLLR
jgi:translation initiation factor 4G